VPLLYTQETWLHGRSVSPVVILAGVLVVFGVNMALSADTTGPPHAEVVSYTNPES
jgi:hypothetical protein